MINPATINLFELPSVTLENRSQLPTTPCIYFAIDAQGQVQYIGKSVNPRKRWIAHHKMSELESISRIRVVYMAISEIGLLVPVESALIAYFDPPLNKTDRLNPFGLGMLGLRLRSGKKAEEIAVEIGVSISTVLNWDQLKTAPRMTPLGLQKLMRVYGCTFEELVQAESEQTGSNR